MQIKKEWGKSKSYQKVADKLNPEYPGVQIRFGRGCGVECLSWGLPEIDKGGGKRRSMVLL